MTIELTQANHERLQRLGLIKTTNESQAARGFERYTDPETKAEYIFSPSGYIYRRTGAGTYQVNRRVRIPGSYNGRRTTLATIRTTDSGALTEYAVKAINNYRN